ncbi:hypothetical protein [Limnohabitans sp.]|uniref:hypothetical protein n=1 Tax=Limnohabitans sp. TaxID=1907725 RepID=UPI00333ECE65
MASSSSAALSGALPPPPPPTWTPQEEAELRKKAQELQKKPAAQPAPPRTEEQIKQAKADKRKRQKEAKKAGAAAPKPEVKSDPRPGSTVEGEDESEGGEAPTSKVKPDSRPGSSAEGKGGPKDEAPLAVKPDPRPGLSAEGEGGSKGKPSFVDSDSDSDDPAEAEEEKAKNELSCAKCSEPIKFRSLMLLMGGGKQASWQGKIWGWCQPCSELPPKEFKKESRRAWESRAQELRGRRQRAHTITFANSKKIIKQMFPDAGKSLIRKLAYQRTKAVVLAFAVAFEKENEFMKKASAENCRIYFEEIERAAMDPTYAASVSGMGLTATEASYLTVLAEGITLSYCCRDPNCLFYGLNHEWCEHLRKYWFRCPACGKWFQPVAAGHGEVPFAFVLNIEDIETGERMNIPCIWPESEEVGWINRQAELKARQLEDEQGLAAFTDSTRADLSQLLRNVGVPGHFQKFDWDPKVEWRVDASVWRYQHLKERGYFWGGKLDPKTVNLAEPYTNWNELITLIARVLVHGRAVAQAEFK